MVTFNESDEDEEEEEEEEEGEEEEDEEGEEVEEQRRQQKKLSQTAVPFDSATSARGLLPGLQAARKRHEEQRPRCWAE